MIADFEFLEKPQKSKANFTLEQVMKAQRGSGSIALLFFKPRQGRATLHAEKGKATHFTGGWIGLRAGMEGVEYLVITKIRFPYSPSRSESL